MTFRAQPLLRLIRRLIPVLLAVAAAGSLRAGSPAPEGILTSPNVFFDEANDLFEKGDHTGAYRLYEQLVEAGHVSPELFYNLGTAAARRNEPGVAMLWYRRAQLLSPSMPEVRQNMEFLRQQIPFLEFTPNQWQRYLRACPPLLGLWIGSASAWIALILVASILIIRRWRAWRPFFILTAILSTLLAIGGFGLHRYYRASLAVEQFATVTSPAASAYVSPLPNAKVVVALPPGSELRLLTLDDYWAYVEIPGGHRGWVRREQVAPHIPASDAPPKA